nr:hypothetical protein orf36 [uncultured bacterium]
MGRVSHDPSKSTPSREHTTCRKYGETPEKMLPKWLNRDIGKLTLSNSGGYLVRFLRRYVSGRYPMRSFLALLFAVLALSMVSPAVACPQGSHPCGPACCPN